MIMKQRSSVGEWGAHNPQARGSKPRAASSYDSEISSGISHGGYCRDALSRWSPVQHLLAPKSLADNLGSRLLRCSKPMVPGSNPISAQIREGNSSVIDG